MNDDPGYNGRQECSNGNATTSAVIVSAGEAILSSPGAESNCNNLVHSANQFVNNSVIVTNATNLSFPVGIQGKS